MNIDFLAGGAHKFNGPKGVGFIYIKSTSKISPFITGGSQERNMRGGTENLYGIVGLAKAFEIAHAAMQQHQEHIQGLKNLAYNGELLRNNVFRGRYRGNQALFLYLYLRKITRIVLEGVLFVELSFNRKCSARRDLRL